MATIFETKKIIGGGYRLNAMCPHCRSLDRERLVYLYLKNKTDVFFRKCTLLHVAPEPNLQKAFQSFLNINYFSIDLDSPLAEGKMDITELKFNENSFDAIICNHVLEHVPDDARAMSELYRVLKPGGWAILQVPISKILNRTEENLLVTDPKVRGKIYGQYDHVREREMATAVSS
jgi:SAM-dependent methyltransferase